MTNETAKECLQFLADQFSQDGRRPFDVAISALNKQIPKKLEHNHHCPGCGKGLPARGLQDEWCSGCFGWTYCPDCGQKVEWE